MSLYLGLDSSTQSLSAMVIDTATRAIVFEASVNFSEAFPEYGTQSGTLRSDDPAVVHAPPLMWVEALEAVLLQVKDGVDVSQIKAVSGSGQQHGSVYLKSFPELDASQSLKSQLAGCFSRETSPIWMDSSTSKQCEEIREALGGMQATTEATGSNTFERFTGPQIRKFYQEEPEAYAETKHIALVSSFMASLLTGKPVGIDPGDGAGMNLMDIQAKQWHASALEATAEDLGSKLPPLSPSHTVAGNIASYFVEKYGFDPGCKSIVWTGDNPSSVIGLGLVAPGMTAISLGTSDTLFGSMGKCATDPNGEGHVFGSPAGDYMTLICFKNGSLAREAILNQYGLGWEGFSKSLDETPAGNHGALMLPWFEPEIVPHVLTPGVHRQNLDESDAAANCRAVVEAQMMSMKLHSEWMGEAPTKIFVTGGASANEQILQVMADVFDCPVHRFESTNSAALGAALRAAHAAGAGEWSDLIHGFTDPVAGSEILPKHEHAAIYRDKVKAYQVFEQAMR